MPVKSARNNQQAFANPPPAPKDMPKAAIDIWNVTIGSRPTADWKVGDLTLLALYARAAADIARLDREISKTGEILKNANGNAQVHPLVSVRGMRERVVWQCLTKLKLTPATRLDSHAAARIQRYADEAASTQGILDSDDLLARSIQ